MPLRRFGAHSKSRKITLFQTNLVTLMFSHCYKTVPRGVSRKCIYKSKLG
jgi:hypothetical protein